MSNTRIHRVYYVYSTSSELVVAWDLPASECTRFEVQYSPRYLGRWHAWDHNYTVPIAVITNLQPSNRYAVRVRAFSPLSGWGDWTRSELDLWTATKASGELPASSLSHNAAFAVTHSVAFSVFNHSLRQLMWYAGVPPHIDATIAGPMVPLLNLSSTPSQSDLHNLRERAKDVAFKLQKIMSEADEEDGADNTATDAAPTSIFSWFTSSKKSVDGSQTTSEAAVKQVSVPATPASIARHKRYGSAASQRDKLPHLSTDTTDEAEIPIPAAGRLLKDTITDFLRMYTNQPDNTTPTAAALRSPEAIKSAVTAEDPSDVHDGMSQGTAAAPTPTTAKRGDAESADVTTLTSKPSFSPVNLAAQRVELLSSMTDILTMAGVGKIPSPKSKNIKSTFAPLIACQRCQHSLAVSTKSSAAGGTEGKSSEGRQAADAAAVSLESEYRRRLPSDYSEVSEEAGTAYVCERCSSFLCSKCRGHIVYTAVRHRGSVGVDAASAPVSEFHPTRVCLPCWMAAATEMLVQHEILSSCFNVVKSTLQHQLQEGASKAASEYGDVPVKEGVEKGDEDDVDSLSVNDVFESFPTPMVIVPDTGMSLILLNCDAAVAFATSLYLSRSFKVLGEAGVWTYFLPKPKSATPESLSNWQMASWRWSRIHRALHTYARKSVQVPERGVRSLPQLFSSRTLISVTNDNTATEAAEEQHQNIVESFIMPNGSVILPPPGLHPAATVRTALRGAASLLEYTTLLQTHKDAVQGLQICRIQDDSVGLKKPAPPVQYEHQHLLFCEGLKRVNVSAAFRQAGLDLAREPGVVVTLPDMSSSLHTNDDDGDDADEAAVFSEPVYRGSAPWLAADQPTVAEDAELIGQYVLLGGEENVPKLDACVRSVFRDFMHARFLSQLPSIAEITASLQELFGSPAHVAYPAASTFAELYASTIRSVVEQAVDVYTTATFVLCSRSYGGGDAHAYAHEIFGNAGRAGDNPMMRSLVVLRHVQPANWHQMYLATEFTSAPFAPLSLSFHDMVDPDMGPYLQMRTQTVDLYQLIDMRNLDGDMWTILRTKIDHAVKIMPAGAISEQLLQDYAEVITRFAVASESDTLDIPSLSAEVQKHLRCKLVETVMPTMSDEYRVLAVQPVCKSPGELRVQMLSADDIGLLKDTFQEDELEEEFFSAIADATGGENSSILSWLSPKTASGSAASELESSPSALRSALTRALWKSLKTKGIVVDAKVLHSRIPIAENRNTSMAAAIAACKDFTHMDKEARAVAILSSDVGVGSALRLGMGLIRDVPVVSSFGRNNNNPAAAVQRRWGQDAVAARSAALDATNSAAIAAAAEEDSMLLMSAGRSSIATRPCVYAILRAGESEIETALHELSFTSLNGKTPLNAAHGSTALVVAASEWTPIVIQALLPKLRAALAGIAAVPQWREGAKLTWDGMSAITLSLWFVPPGTSVTNAVANTFGATATAADYSMSTRSRSASRGALDGCVSEAAASAAEKSVAAHICLGTATVPLVSLLLGIPHAVTVPITTRVHVSCSIPRSAVLSDDAGGGKLHAPPVLPTYDALLSQYKSQQRQDSDSVRSVHGSEDGNVDGDDEDEDDDSIVHDLDAFIPTELLQTRAPRPSAAVVRRYRAQTGFAGTSTMEAAPSPNAQTPAASSVASQHRVSQSLHTESRPNSLLFAVPRTHRARSHSLEDSNFNTNNDGSTAERRASLNGDALTITVAKDAAPVVAEEFVVEEFVDVVTGTLSLELYYWRKPTVVHKPRRYVERQERKRAKQAAKLAAAAAAGATDGGAVVADIVKKETVDDSKTA